MKSLHRSLHAWHVAVLLLAAACPSLAVPTFQTYIVGATAGDFGQDQDTWLITGGTFDLVLVGAYQGNVTSLTNGRLVVSVPQGQTGTLTIGGLSPITIGADLDVLTNVAGNEAFDTKSNPPFPQTFNEHYPFQAQVANFIVYDVGDFPNTANFVHNYSAEDGTITLTGNTGTEKTFPVAIDGFSWAHFDLFGLVSRPTGHTVKTTWEINPGSHDSSFIPAPGALLLGALGTGLVGWLRRCRAL